jgi:hypothetical protein
MSFLLLLHVAVMEAQSATCVGTIFAPFWMFTEKGHDKKDTLHLAVYCGQLLLQGWHTL